MNLGEFKDRLRAAIKRGDSYDEELGSFARRAARWIEQNSTLQYMRRRISLDSVSGENVIALPTDVPIKSLEFLRFDAADGTIINCSKGELSDPEIQWMVKDRYGEVIRTIGSTAWPSHFYMDGVEALVFNRTFPEDIPGQGIAAIYSDFPVADNKTHWLLQNAEGLMLRQSMIEFMTSARDDRGYAVAVAQRDQDLKALQNADFELRWTGQDIQL
jgi:hypothetical protein